ncbi:MAG: DUF4864 domain-containing protein [Janthinobacterium lividum]
MKSRPIAAAFFAAFCLLLCGMVLHRQIAAHPLLQRFDDHHQEESQASEMNPHDWQTANPAVAQQARNTIQGQLTALNDGDGLKAMSYQSRFMRRSFVSPEQFESMIVHQYPEFGHCRQAHYGLIRTDKTSHHVRADVIVEGENGHRARGEYLLVREGAEFKIIGVRTDRLPN